MSTETVLVFFICVKSAESTDSFAFGDAHSDNSDYSQHQLTQLIDLNMNPPFQWYILRTEIQSTFHARVECIPVKQIRYWNQWG